jgi:hypothetical protein
LLFSVMTFGALLTQVGESRLTVAVIVLAFQAGFFWQTILKQPSEPRDEAALGRSK